MELHKIEKLLEKYFDAETSIAEEQELKAYFGSADVVQHLEQYKPMFGYFGHAQTMKSERSLPLKPRKLSVGWLSVAASVVVLLGVGTFAYFHSGNVNEDLGTYDDPEVAFMETQKALSLLSQNVNVGVGSMEYLNEYEVAKNKVFTLD
jgi:hypothetical protein